MKQEVEKTVCKIIVMANQKGGVAKTSSTRNLAYSLAEMGQRVLAVDFDPQTNLTISFGNLLAKLYEDRVSEIITARNFSMLSQKYQEEQEQLEAKITALNSQLETAREQVVNTEKWVDLVRQYTDLNELTADVLNGMIEKILIHEAVKDGEGNRVQEIEIFYRFVGNIDQLSKPVSLTA